ncbi:MAG: TIGR02099 family protein [Burkholderiales bacterium]|nr:TIGR02099 family protein [Burkholderiales bacterium]
MLKLLILTHRLARRLIVASSVAVFFVLASLILILRYWFLPNIENYHADIARTISAAIGEKVAIGSIEADWMGVSPHLILRNVRILDESGQAALTLDRVENSLSWLTFLTGEIRFASLEIDQPRLGVRRDEQGRFYVAGIPMSQGPANRGISDWLLRQDQVVIKDGFILWEDDMRGTPPLMLGSVNFALVNSRHHHLFGLQATPPAELASPLDVRGNLFGDSMNEPGDWRGKLYARIDYADIAELRKWLPFTQPILSGTGAVRIWLDFAQMHPDALTADIHLSKVRAKLGSTLPEIGMKTLRGRIAWSDLDGGYEVRTKQLALETDEGESIKPTDFLMQSIPARENSAEQGQLSANSLDLGTLSRLVAHFPLPDAIRDALVKFSPRGKLGDLQVKWKGDAPESDLFPWKNHPRKKPSGTWQMPAHYSVAGRLENLGITLSGNSFSGISGHVDGNENGGSFNLDAHHPKFLLPATFESAVEFDTLTAQAKWQNDKTGFGISFSNISFANRDLAGNAFGSYGNNFADFTGRLTRVDASQVWRYLPSLISKEARNWVKNAIIHGDSDDAKIRLQGKLDEFPFDHKNGIFQAAVKVRGATLAYAPGWPRIDSVAADLLFQGSRMEITSHQGSMLGAKLAHVQAGIDDLDNPNAVLEIEGDASGATDEFLQFIEQSPITKYIDGFTTGMHAAGNGSLKLKLGIPLARAENTKVSGSYQFLGNAITGPGIPDISHLNGRLDFSESMVSTRNAGATILGGTALINASTQKDGGLKVLVSGKIDPDNIATPLARHFHGKADWRSAVTVRKKKTDILIESTLQGLSSNLPAPFTKNAASILPVRFEKRAISQDEDLVTLSYGNILAARFVGATKNGFRRFDKGIIYLDKALPAELPEAPGIWLAGSLKTLDADSWRDILEEGGGGENPITLAGIDVDIGSLSFLGKHFGKLAISARQSEGNWQAALSGVGVNGSVKWLPEGKGRLIAKLRDLSIPEATPADRETVGSKVALLAKVAGKNLPALDITADNFVVRNKEVGRLEFVAVQQGNDWKIEKLRISNPDSVLTADGLWQGWAIHPRTNVNLKLDVGKIGKFLSRFGYPDNIMRGSGKMEGTLSWAGSPQSVNYATLNGNIVMTASHGQFNKIDPGIGKLLGILSLQEIPRRITLDFRDIFSEGFAFDDISSSLKITDGIATTGDLKIVGPAAEVDMNGRIDLDKETQDLQVVVKPQLGGSFSIASSLLGGPVVGIATWVVGKVLQNPLDQIASYEYNITGSWTDPIVKKAQDRK